MKKKGLKSKNSVDKEQNNVFKSGGKDHMCMCTFGCVYEVVYICVHEVVYMRMYVFEAVYM